jgi:deoxyribonuclease IV
MKIGCHVSIREGYLGAAKRAHILGANAFQYFPKNPRSLGVKAFDKLNASQCADFCKEHEMVSIAHTPYPTNPSATGEKAQWVIDSLKNDLEIAEACGSIGIVVHFGSNSDDPLLGYQQMIQTFNDVLKDWAGDALLLIENNAGKGDQLGTTMEELTKIRSLVDHPEKVGFCLDTCHAFAANLWNGEDWETVLERGEALDFIAHIKAIHFNNSVYPNGSRKDRHAPIDNGEIPWEAMKEVLETEELRETPFILETPGPHDVEIKLIKDITLS